LKIWRNNAAKAWQAKGKRQRAKGKSSALFFCRKEKNSSTLFPFEICLLPFAFLNLCAVVNDRL
jgi:hypothetical protein